MEKKFAADAYAEGLLDLTGHPHVGALRASFYSSMETEGVQKLLDFMERWRQENPIVAQD